MNQYPYSGPYQQPGYPPPRQGMPAWVVVLIVCGVLALLLPIIMGALLFPVFVRAREKGRAVTCMRNVKQLSLAAMQYTADYDDHLPDAAIWTREVLPYAPDPILYVCPSAQATGGGYAYNREMDHRTLGKLQSPQTAILFYDTINPAPNATDAVTSLPRPGRHLGRDVIGYADGHLAQLQPENLLATNGHE